MTSRSRKSVNFRENHTHDRELHFTTPCGCKNLIRIIKQSLAYFAKNNRSEQLQEIAEWKLKKTSGGKLKKK